MSFTTGPGIVSLTVIFFMIASLVAIIKAITSHALPRWQAVLLVIATFAIPYVGAISSFAFAVFKISSNRRPAA